MILSASKSSSTLVQLFPLPSTLYLCSVYSSLRSHPALYLSSDIRSSVSYPSFVLYHSPHKRKLGVRLKVHRSVYVNPSGRTVYYLWAIKKIFCLLRIYPLYYFFQWRPLSTLHHLTTLSESYPFPLYQGCSKLEHNSLWDLWFVTLVGGVCSTLRTSVVIYKRTG